MRNLKNEIVEIIFKTQYDDILHPRGGAVEKIFELIKTDQISFLSPNKLDSEKGKAVRRFLNFYWKSQLKK